MHLEKYHASGNDFIIVAKYHPDFKKLAKRLCSRHTSIGADGLIYYNILHREVQFYNADGSQADLCGNGLRCLSLYLYRHRIRTSYVLINNQVYYLNGNNKIPFQVTISFPNTEYLIEERDVKIDDQIIPLSFIDVGNRHAIKLINKHEKITTELAKNISALDDQNYNVDFVKILSRDKLSICTYERGVGFTSSCGSGALASALVLKKNNLINDQVTIINRLGNIIVNIQAQPSISGDAHYLFEVETCKNLR